MTEPELALPDGYRELLEDLKRTVAAARWRTQRTVNTELLTLYWRLGDAVLQRQHAEGWGTRVIDRLGTNLRAAFPDMRGLSRSNIKYMRQMAGAWTQQAIGQQPVGQPPWGHVTVLGRSPTTTSTPGAEASLTAGGAAGEEIARQPAPKTLDQ